MKVMTFNLKNDLAKNHFNKRSQAIINMIEEYKPDIIAVQELTEKMILGLSTLQNKYTFFGEGRYAHDNPQQERCCILFSKDKYEFIEGSTFWLSDSPNKVGTKYKMSIFPRIATIAVLKDKETEKTLTICNTHLDHLFAGVRYKQIIVLKKEINKRKKGDYLFVTGDFNSVLYQSPLQYLLKNNDLKAVIDYKDSCTMRGIVHTLPGHFSAIDHILVSDNLEIKKAEIIRKTYDGIYPSDHYPVIANIDD